MGTSAERKRRAATTEPEDLVAAARSGDEAAFTELVERYRRELRVHCYRMVGSFTESEDLVQETFLRAWRGLAGFEGRASFRAWLYRIATNTCLDALARQPRRHLAYDVVPETDPDHPPAELTTYRSIEPFPDHLLEGEEPGDATVAKETIELAFLAAIQHLTPQQRAVLVLRDVLGWSAKATADALDITEAAVKSTLQRARPILRRRLPVRRHEWAPTTDPTLTERVLLQRYMDAHEQDDVDALAAVLRDDVRVSYAPLAIWSESRDVFINASRKYAPPGDYRFVATRANLQPAAAIYLRPPGEPAFRLTALEVLRMEGDQIVEIIDFDIAELAEAFGLPATL